MAHEPDPVPPPSPRLFRLGRQPDPLAWTPWPYVGSGRLDDWYIRRAVASLRGTPGAHWLDLRSLDTRERLRRLFAPRLRELGLADFDVSTVRGPHRERLAFHLPQLLLQAESAATLRHGCF